jgi:hypothetical protein
MSTDGTDNTEQEQQIGSEEELDGTGEVQSEQAESPPPPNKVGREDELAKRLSQVEGSLAETGMMAKLMADPEIRAVLEARQRGEKVEVRKAGQVREEEEKEEDLDLDSLSPSKLAGVIVRRTVRELRKGMDEELGGIREQIKGLVSHAQASSAERTSAAVAEVREKHSDFDALVPQMIEINKKVGGTLGPEELYVLAKVRSGGSGAVVRPDPRTESERPSSTVSRPGQRRKEPVPAGARGFGQLLDEALSSIKVPTAR